MPDANVTLVYAHPFSERSLANRELLAEFGDLPFLRQRHLYDLYPDFDIDGDAERAVLEATDLLVIQHPVYWYSMPALLKLWIDEVFSLGWAYGEGGNALAGKSMQWVVTTGGDFRAYTPEGPHGHPFEVFVAPVRQTARFCGMHWLEPIVVHDAHTDREHVAAAGRKVRERLVQFDARHRAHRAKADAASTAASNSAPHAALGHTSDAETGEPA